MVNIPKRMRKLNLLLAIRNGPGAAILPQTKDPKTHPKVTRLHLAFPLENTSKAKDNLVVGARAFWRGHLRRLKYHNPGLPITVQHEKGVLDHPKTFTIFWSDQPTGSKTTQIGTGSSSGQSDSKTSQKSNENTKSSPSKIPSNSNNNPLPTSSTTGTTHPPSSIPTSDYASSISVERRTARYLWRWLEEQTGSKPAPISAEDTTLSQQLREFEKHSEEDRQRVKEGVDRMRAEEAQRRKAVEETARMKGEL